MNEVKNTQPAAPPVARVASSKGAADVPAMGNLSAVTGKKLPVSADMPVEKSAEIAREARQRIEAAVASINDYVQSVQRDLQFTVDEELNRTVIRVIDSESGNIIRQIPEEVFLDLARKLNDDGEFQLVNALG